MESYKFVTIDEAIAKLKRLKKENKKALVCIINFDNDNYTRKFASFEESCNIIRNGKTIAHNQDTDLSHLEVFSVLQNDKNNILPVGIMHDILIGKLE